MTGAVPHVVHRLHRRVGRVRRPPWFTDESARLYAQSTDPWRWKSYHGPRWWRYLADQVTAGRERLGAHDFLRRKAALGGVTTCHPFLQDLDLIELALQIPPEFVFDRDLDRPLLRETTKGSLPRAVRLRRDKSDLTALSLECIAGPDWPAMASLLSSDKLELARYVRPAVVRERAVDAPPQPRTAWWGQAVWQLFSIEVWLRFQSDPSFPGRLLERLDVQDRTNAPTTHHTPVAVPRFRRVGFLKLGRPRS